MSNSFLETLQTPSVERAQEEAFGRARSVGEPSGEVATLGAVELEFIAERDSFYLASTGETGWPYVQHRGGAKGFLTGLAGGRCLAFLDLEGNRQLISVGNIAVNDRVTLFLMDYPRRERLKIIGRARVVPLEDEPEIAAALGAEENTRAARLFLIDVVGFDWNCSKGITPRFTRDEVEVAMQALRARIVDLEGQLQKRDDV